MIGEIVKFVLVSKLSKLNFYILDVINLTWSRIVASKLIYSILGECMQFIEDGKKIPFHGFQHPTQTNKCCTLECAHRCGAADCQDGEGPDKCNKCCSATISDTICGNYRSSCSLGKFWHLTEALSVSTKHLFIYGIMKLMHNWHKVFFISWKLGWFDGQHLI